MKKTYLYPTTHVVSINASSSVLSIVSPAGDIMGSPGGNIGDGSSKN